MGMNNWIKHELRYLSLGDERLNARCVKLVAGLAAQPGQSVPQALGSWAATKAAYRFWDNERVRPQDIRAAHRRATVDRLPPTGPVLALQDTTTFNFSDHPATRDLGYLSHPPHMGLWMHSVLCASSAGVPLGLLHQQMWTRPLSQLGKRKQRRHKATADKESQRWLTGLQATFEAVPAERAIITVADREADFYDLFAAPRRPGLDLLIRARGRRRVRHELKLLGPALRAQDVAGTLTVTVPRKPGQPEREARLTIRSASFVIKPPSTHPQRRQCPDLPLQAVLAEEETPPPGCKAISWLLLTTLPVESLAQAVQAVRWYSVRWLIERFHYTLKSGCKVEELQLEAVDRLYRALATYALVAWRLLWLTYEARQRPEASCEEVLNKTQWQVLCAQVQPKRSMPSQPPNLAEAVRWIAQLGGFLARTGDGDPGVKTLWRGWRRLDDLVRGYHLVSQLKGPPFVGNG
jgi:hypothetical protein